MVRRLLSFGNVFTTLWSGYYRCVVMLLPLCGNHITKVLERFGERSFLIELDIKKMVASAVKQPSFFCRFPKMKSLLQIEALHRQ